MQRLLNHADCNADAVRGDLRDYVVEHLGDDAVVLGGRAAVLTVSDAGYWMAS